MWGKISVNSFVDWTIIFLQSSVTKWHIILPASNGLITCDKEVSCWHLGVTLSCVHRWWHGCHQWVKHFKVTITEHNIQKVFLLIEEDQRLMLREITVQVGTRHQEIDDSDFGISGSFSPLVLCLVCEWRLKDPIWTCRHCFFSDMLPRTVTFFSALTGDKRCFHHFYTKMKWQHGIALHNIPPKSKRSELYP